MSIILDEPSCFQEIRLQIWNERLKKPDMANFLSNQTRSSYFDQLLAILNHCGACLRACMCVCVSASNIKIVSENILVCVAFLRVATIPNCNNCNKVWKKTLPKSAFPVTVKPLSSYFLLSYGVAAGWLMVSRDGVSGTRQLAHSSSFWPVIGTSNIFHVPALSKIREVSLHFIFVSNKIFCYWFVVIKWCFYLYLFSSLVASSH